jgi:hypothetical protein
MTNEPLFPDDALTVGELVDFLLTFPRDMRILVSGYETGYDDPRPPRVIEVEESGYVTGYNGRYDVTPTYFRSDLSPVRFTAVVLER